MSKHLEKQFVRVYLSFQDMEACTTYLDEAKKADGEGNWIVLAGLISAAIVSYARPFSDNEQHESANPNPPFKKSILSAEELILHNRIITLRNKVIAHSDAELNPAKLTIRTKSGFTVASAIYSPNREAEELDVYKALANKVKLHFESKLFELSQQLDEPQ